MPLTDLTVHVRDGASHAISDNTVIGNALDAIRVAKDAHPKIDQNVARA